MKSASSTFFLFFLFTCFLIWGCENPTGGGEDEEASAEKQFVWNGLNQWYYWQESVPELADDRFADEQDLHDYLNGFRNERELFESLLSPEDNFSFFIDNYEEFRQSQQGRSESFGFSFGLVQRERTSPELFGYVQYVYDSSAEEAGLTRGDSFTEVNGTVLTISNYQDLLGGSNLNLTMATVESTNPYVTENTGETVEISARNLQENPVLTTRVLDTGSTSVGYLLYNSFRFNFHEELNDAFGEFSAEGINELVLDLRYNTGGAVISSILLASLISGRGESDIFAEFIYNEKQQDRNDRFPFLEEVPVWDVNGDFIDWGDNMNQLSLDRVYILTSRGTASASETLINGLNPFMEVILIGQQTRGKDEGSITLYDSPPDYNSREETNPDHMRAMQPIVFKIFNEREEDYPDGFLPVETISEIKYLDNLPPLGDENEPLLSRALELIAGEAPIARRQAPALFHGEIFTESGAMRPADSQMYLIPVDPDLPSEE